METLDSDWGRVYPNIITWTTKTGYHQLSWVRFWREGNEYQIPVRMDVDGVVTIQEGSKYDERFHAHCLEMIRHGRAYGDYKEPIKFNDKHVVTVTYEELDDIGKVEEDVEKEKK